MTTASWLMLGTAGLLLGYELVLLAGQWARLSVVARAAHGGLRAQWVEVLSQHPGTEVLAVQTLRNAVMSSTMIASTAAIGLIGAANLAAPSMRSSFGDAGLVGLNARLVLELAVIGLLFSSLVTTAMAVRYYNHVGFMVSMPVGSAARAQWSSTSVLYLRRAGFLYGVGLHHLLLVAPLLAAIVYPLAGVPSAVVVIVVLVGFDRFAPLKQAPPTS